MHPTLPVALFCVRAHLLLDFTIHIPPPFPPTTDIPLPLAFTPFPPRPPLLPVLRPRRVPFSVTSVFRPGLDLCNFVPPFFVVGEGAAHNLADIDPVPFPSIPPSILLPLRVLGLDLRGREAVAEVSRRRRCRRKLLKRRAQQPRPLFCDDTDGYSGGESGGTRFVGQRGSRKDGTRRMRQRWKKDEERDRRARRENGRTGSSPVDVELCAGVPVASTGEWTSRRSARRGVDEREKEVKRRQEAHPMSRGCACVPGEEVRVGR